MSFIDVRPGTAPPTNPHETDTDRFVETPSRGLGAPLESTVPASVGETGAAAAAGADGTADASVPRTETITTSNGARFVLFLDHVIAQTNGTIVYAGERLKSDARVEVSSSDDEREPVAIKRVSLRTFDTEAWYRDGRTIEREALAAKVFEDVTDSHVLPLLGHILDSASFTFVYPLAVTTLDHVVAAVADAKGITRSRPFGEPTANRSPVQHDPAKGALVICTARAAPRRTQFARLVSSLLGGWPRCTTVGSCTAT